MIKIEKFYKVDPEWWDSIIKQSQSATAYQSAYWAEYLKTRLGVKPIFLLAKASANDNVLAALLIFKVVRGFLGQRILADSIFRPFIPVLVAFFGRLTWTNGPVFISSENKEEVLLALLKEIESLAKEERTPGVRYANLPADVACANSDFEGIFTSLGYSYERRATIRVDLSREPEELWDSLKSSAKKVLKKRKVYKNIVIREATNIKDIKQVQKLIKESRNNPNFRKTERSHPYHPTELMFRMLHNKGFLKIFIVESEGRVLSTLGIFTFNGNINEFGSAQSAESIKAKMYPNDLLKWHIIEWASKNGMRCYDLAEVAREPKSEKEKNIRQFKEKWGGEYCEYNMYTKKFR